MNDQAKIVLWLGFLMIALQVIRNWAAVSSLIFTAPASASSGVPGLSAAGQSFGAGVATGIIGNVPGASSFGAGAASGFGA